MCETLTSCRTGTAIIRLLTNAITVCTACWKSIASSVTLDWQCRSWVFESSAEDFGLVSCSRHSPCHVRRGRGVFTIQNSLLFHCCSLFWHTNSIFESSRMHNQISQYGVLSRCPRHFRGHEYDAPGRSRSMRERLCSLAFPEFQHFESGLTTKCGCVFESFHL